MENLLSLITDMNYNAESETNLGNQDKDLVYLVAENNKFKDKDPK